jgi:PAS domain S-box-containing protein
MGQVEGVPPRLTRARRGNAAPLSMASHLAATGDGDGRLRREVSDARRRLRQNEEAFRLLVQVAKDYAIFMLDPEGNVATWNEGAQRINRYETEEILGRHFSVFYEDSDVRSGKPDWELVVAETEGQCEDEGWRIRKDGTRFWANVVITALREEDGTLRGFAKVTRDITAKQAEAERRREEERREAEQLRQHAERMVELERIKSDFLNLASHELRGPLAILKGYIRMLAEGTLSPEQQADVLPLLSAKVQQMALLVQDMLETARIEDGRLSLDAVVLDLRDLAREVVQGYQHAARKKHVLSVSSPDRPVLVMGDRVRVEAIMSNLLDNAIKYSPDGGPVTCLVARSGARAFFSVQDCGLGIASDDMSKLFTRFGRLVTRENSNIGGTGLGLYLSQEIAQRHGGSILVESKPGRGSRFTLTLPAEPSRPDANRSAALKR